MRVVETFESQDRATLKCLTYLDKFKSLASDNLVRKLCRAVAMRSTQLLVVFDIDDTLVRDDSSPLPEVVLLFKKLRRIGAKIFLITARHPKMRKQTVSELMSIGIDPMSYEELMITPKEYRTSMKKVGEWKFFARQSIATRYGAPIALTIGDQWTDVFKVGEEEMTLLDQAYPQPFVFGFVEDDYTLMFLKLKSMH